ncbi:hypothetical protein Ccrd_008657 [Cynara cardunculus var. scolymus]|uniref:Uncharacterized protein n=1 Tax=Cynara cardunculus var. scolymus TaxID=59895 RepID=A0A103XEQ7_CYNCS|nr:hypothetical protein Ccrd_008657 [Cynara cardunculus var. scolymus]
MADERGSIHQKKRELQVAWAHDCREPGCWSSSSRGRKETLSGGAHSRRRRQRQGDRWWRWPMNGGGTVEMVNKDGVFLTCKNDEQRSGEGDRGVPICMWMTRLRQHNGELKGGAKASQAGRPWICACLIRGFASKSEACKFEFKWKNVSSKMPRKRKSKEEEGGIHLLQHRNAALNKVKDSSDCSHLEFEWKLEPI